MNIQTAFRLEESLLARLKQLSKDDGRSMTWHVDKALNAYLKPEKKKKPVKRFDKPSREDVITYCYERGGVIDGEKFYDYCEAKGWKLSNGNQMKDWQAAIRTWEGRKRDQQQKRESLIERTERKAKEKLTAIENAHHPLGKNDGPLWLQVDER